jgi:hypothetical protein
MVAGVYRFAAVRRLNGMAGTHHVQGSRRASRAAGAAIAGLRA